MSDETGKGLAELRKFIDGGGPEGDHRGRMETGLLLRYAETTMRLMAALARARGCGGTPLSPEQLRGMLGFTNRSDPRTPFDGRGRRAFYHPEALEDLQEWVKENPNAAWEAVHLCEMARRSPFEGEGDPARLFYVLDGAWSRRIRGPHRLVYRVTDTRVDILVARLRLPPPPPETPE